MDKLSITQNTNKYTAKILNISKNLDISNFISECNISLPKTNEISSMSANFTLDEKLIDTGNEIRIEILDEVDNILYSLQGLATLEKRNKKYTGQESYQYSVKDSYDKLFDKVVPETVVFFDLFFCNVNDKSNSLLHIVAEKLGFREEQLDFADITYSDGSLIRVPFVLFEQDERWIDILQRFIKATDSILYIRDKKLFCRPRNFDLNTSLEFNRTNIITEIEEVFKTTQYNGIRVSYDRFIKLENQVVFNLSQKIIVDENKPVGSEAQSMRITYSTSSVSNPTLTKATGYYFSTPGDVHSKVSINLVKDTHYVIEEWKETQAIVKFYNPYQHKLYIDNFEIKGLPLVKYQDNESVIKNPNVIEKYQENFITIQKNREVQTEKLAKHIALSEYKSQIVNNKEYTFNTHFLKDVELGGVYSLSIEDIQTVIRVNNIQIHLKPSQFVMKIQAECVKESSEFTYSSVLSGKSNTSFIDLKSIEEKIEKNEKDLKILDRDIKSRLFKQKTQPDSSEVKENDIWLNPETNVWKKFYNGVWNSISEDEILPSMKMYNSVETNVIKLQGTADKVGAYLLNDGEKFGSLNGELAHVTFDKLGQFEAINPNNKIALNIKDPANPSIVKSQILLGVTNVTDSKWNDTIFAIGDETSNNRIEFKNGRLSQKVNGKNLEETIKGIGREITFEVGGEADKYYPVHFTSSYRQCKLLVYRKFNEKAPNTWNTATHKGSLELGLSTNFYSNWSGHPNSINVNRFKEIYSTMASKIEVRNNKGVFIWLRGGGAVYHAYCDDSIANKDLSATVYLNGFDSSILGGSYALPQYKFILQPGTYTETGEAVSIKNLFTDEKIKEAYDYANTIQGALETGDFTITGKTNFDGSARFISRGTNEVITIANGAIDFHRDGQRLTRIKNISYGVIATDSKGKGIVNFAGFKQPMVVLTTIKSANFGKNMASIFCYAEHIQGAQYRFYVGGTNEHYTEAKPIKVVGNTWTMNNVVISTLLGITGHIDGMGTKTLTVNSENILNRTGEIFSTNWKVLWSRWDGSNFNKIENFIIKKIPKFRVNIKLNTSIIFSKDFTMFCSTRGVGNEKFNFYCGGINFDNVFNILKKMQRTNIEYAIEIIILEKDLVVDFEHRHEKRGNNGQYTRTYYQCYIPLFTITQAKFKGLSITASAETSTLSGVTGTGEVQYIAMEID